MLACNENITVKLQRDSRPLCGRHIVKGNEYDFDNRVWVNDDLPLKCTLSAFLEKAFPVFILTKLFVILGQKVHFRGWNLEFDFKSFTVFYTLLGPFANVIVYNYRKARVKIERQMSTRFSYQNKPISGGLMGGGSNRLKPDGQINKNQMAKYFWPDDITIRPKKTRRLNIQQSK